MIGLSICLPSWTAMLLLLWHFKTILSSCFWSKTSISDSKTQCTSANTHKNRVSNRSYSWLRKHWKLNTFVNLQENFKLGNVSTGLTDRFLLGHPPCQRSFKQHRSGAQINVLMNREKSGSHQPQSVCISNISNSHMRHQGISHLVLTVEVIARFQSWGVQPALVVFQNLSWRWADI